MTTKKAAAKKFPSTKGKPAPQVIEQTHSAPTIADNGVCAVARYWANTNPDAGRKDGVEALVAMGIHKSTAALQIMRADRKAGRVRPS